jgi:hypothetical protein
MLLTNQSITSITPGRTLLDDEKMGELAVKIRPWLCHAKPAA